MGKSEDSDERCCSIAESAEGEGEEEREEPAVVGVNQEISPADVFFLDVIPVPPSRFRPVSAARYTVLFTVNSL